MNTEQCYVRVTDSLVEQCDLPHSYENVSGLPFQTEEVQRQYGFFRAEVRTPVFEASTHRLDDPEFVWDEPRGLYTKVYSIVPLEINQPVSVLETSVEDDWMRVRQDRFTRLQNSDWVELPSIRNSSTDAYLKSWDDYRNAVRNAIDVEKPEDVVWPVAPHSPILGPQYPHGSMR